MFYLLKFQHYSPKHTTPKCQFRVPQLTNKIALRYRLDLFRILLITNKPNSAYLGKTATLYKSSHSLSFFSSNKIHPTIKDFKWFSRIILNIFAWKMTFKLNHFTISMLSPFTLGHFMQF